MPLELGSFKFNKGSFMTTILVSFEATKPPLFPLGELIVTPNVLEGVSDEEIRQALDRHSHGDWGEVDGDDQVANKRALENGGRIVSEYTAKSGTKFCVITEPNHYVTTVVLPEED
jgi:hypothetical protein